jgi:hypothetical protein
MSMEPLMELSKKRPRDESVLATTFTVHVIFRSDFVQIMQRFPTFQAIAGDLVVVIAGSRVKWGWRRLGRALWASSSSKSKAGEGAGIRRMNPDAFAGVPLVADIG